MEAPIESIHSPSVSSCVTLKLTEENYLPWKSQFVAFLSCQNLLGFVDGSEKRPASTISVTKASDDASEVRNRDQAWFRSDQLIRSWLVDSLSQEMLRLVIDCDTSHEIWSTLASHFNRISISRLGVLNRRFYRMKKENKPMSEYLRDFRSVCNQLESFGHPVRKEMKIFGLLQGLGRDYLTFTMIIECSMDYSLDLSFENVVSQLKRFDDRRRSYNDSCEVTHHLDFNNGYSSNYRGTGFHQQITARTTSDCCVCQICGGRRHLALSCRHRFDRDFDYDEEPSGFGDLCITDVTDSHGEEWYP